MPAALTALLIVVIGLLVGSPSPTPALGPDAPARQFSAARATPHVAAIAKAPRPTGSAAHAEARAYLLDRLAELGIPATVHTGSVATTFGVSDTGGDARYAGARVHNVVARVPGADSTRPVALVTHYDSTPAGPGANDAGVPVAVLLETARALAEGPAHRNDLLLVFTDAEEAGLLGAKALVADPDALPPDAVVVNVEARGGGGPTIPFETGPDSGWLIGLLAEHAPHPQAGSVVTEAYRFMPNLTDFTVLREHGHSGLNLTYLRELTRYHGANDTADSVDPDTVQHQGETVLALARALVSADLRTPPVGDSAHFTEFGRVVHHDTTRVVPLAVLAVLGTALALAGA
ncbi:M20/M25/M40 family metallo-hydrolase, partial [Actinosynnema sp.]|uniref:M20/M25/M40 family metallo-hydrolase n=1 Tax=Actinosynnema sp. TaxID=1872144 RepID=UPI003F86D777